MKVYQCDRCKAIFEPRILANGEPYVTKKNCGDIDLCPVCYNDFCGWLLNKGARKYDDCDGATLASGGWE